MAQGEVGGDRDLCFLTIGEAGRLIREMSISPVELTQAFLDRIERIDSKVKSYVTLIPEAALA